MVVNGMHTRTAYPDPVAPVPERLTIDAVAQRAGTKVSTIRLYQQRGLLPPPVIEGRVGFYDDAHLARLRLIADLQARGYSLAAIRELADTWESGRDLDALLGIERALAGGAGNAAGDGRRRRIERAELERRFPELHADLALAQRFEALDLMRPVGDVPDEGAGLDLVEIDQGFLDVGALLHSLGVPLGEMLDEFEAVQEFARATAQRYVGLFERFVWEPFVAAGATDPDAQQVAQAIAVLREAGVSVVSGALRQAIDTAASDAVVRHAADVKPARGRKAGAVAARKGKP
jgi:DNA-binding transcriptional MerR regulator